MLIRNALVACLLFYCSSTLSQTLTLAGGNTIRSKISEHNSYRVEMNFGWKPEVWGNGGWTLSLNHALSVMTFRDENTVNAISWAPNIILSSRETSGIRPYLQFGFGVAYLSDDKFESEPEPHPMYTLDGVTDVGSHGQFESSLALGLGYKQFSIRAKVYHYSNAGIASQNDGIDVAEFGISYSF